MLRLRERRVTVKAIAEKFGRTEKAVDSKLAKIRRGGLHLRGRLPDALTPFENQDAAYVAACLAQGGFVAARIVNGRTVWVRPSKVAA